MEDGTSKCGWNGRGEWDEEMGWMHRWSIKKRFHQTVRALRQWTIDIRTQRAQI